MATKSSKPSTKPRQRPDTNPSHYRIEINGKEVQVVDIMEAFFIDDAHLSQAVKYLLRAGRKPGSSYVKDVGKALWWCARALRHKDAIIDLPPTVRQKDLTIDGKPIL